MSFAPALPRGWFGKPPDTATTVFCVLCSALFAAPGLFCLRSTVRAVAAHDYPLVIGRGILTAFLLSMATTLLITVLSPRPRVVRTAQGVSITPARVVTALLATVGISLALVLTMLGFAVLGGESLGSSSAGQRWAHRLPALSVVVVAILLTLIGRVVLGRLRGEARYLITLAPETITFSDKGCRKELPWSEITDVKVGPPAIRLQRLGASQLYIYTTLGGEDFPLMVDRYLQMGGAWLVDTIRFFWQNPYARAELTRPD